MTQDQTGTGTGTGTGKRADARRNRAALVAAAAETFAAFGPDAPLDAIARRAGVGNATLYRHFPTRADLLVAVCVDDVDELVELSREAGASAPSSYEALNRWLRAYMEHVGARSGLASALRSMHVADAGPIRAAHETMSAACESLLGHARAEGTVRRDVRTADLLALVNAAASVVEAEPHDGERTLRLLRLLMEGVRKPPTE